MTVCALILAYDNFEGLIEVVKNLKGQTRPPDQFLIIDNASSDDTYRIKTLFPEIKYVRLEKNLGSAGGYNRGLKIASEMADAIFISDDDTLYERFSLKKLCEFMSFVWGKEKIGAARCAWEKFPHRAPLKIKTSGWSGVMISSGAVKNIGLPREDFFIYGDDIEYFLRMSKAGYSFYVVPGTGYIRRPSEHKIKLYIGSRRIEFYRAEFRLYYAFRNEIYTYLLYKRYLDVLRVILYFIKCVAFTNFSGIKAMLYGMVDGFTGRLGPNNFYPVNRKK